MDVRRLLGVVAVVSFSVMFAISVVGPLLGRLAEADGIPLGGRPNTSIGAIFALGGLALAASQVPFARLADRLGRRGFIVAGSLGVAVTGVLIGYSRILAESLGLPPHSGDGWDSSTYILAVSRTLEGAAAAATWPVLMSVIASEVPPDSMGAAMGVFGASFGLGMSLGPVVGPAVAAAAGVHAPS